MSRQIVVRGLLLGLLLTVLGAGGFLGLVAWYAGTDRLLPGVIVGGVRVGGLRLEEALSRLEGSSAGGGLLPPGGISLRHGDRVWLLPQDKPGLSDEAAAVLREASAVGRRGSLWQRSLDFLVGVVHGHYFPLKARLREAALEERIRQIALELDRPPADARYDVTQGRFLNEVPGQELDVAATLAAVKSALAEGQPEAEATVRPVEPSVRVADLPEGYWYEVSRFLTPILSAEPGRVRNIALAVERISGLVISPGQVFSFNEVVGPRDPAYGWAQAQEIYQGEYVMGYGGGICQVASTLYNAVLLAGLEVTERHHHERPLQYVDPGRDATVAWDELDFKFRNNTEMPLVLAARILPGSPQQIEVTIRAPEPPVTPIRIEEADLRYYPPAMEEEPDPSLPFNQRKVVDEGYYGLEVKIYRVYGSGPEERRELVSHDRYLPKPGKVRVGTGNPTE